MARKTPAMRCADWDGVANGEAYTMREKQWARRGELMPEDVERSGAQALGGEEHALIKTMWRGGCIDADAKGGEGRFSMTREQSAAWKKARAASGRGR